MLSLINQITIKMYRTFFVIPNEDIEIGIIISQWVILSKKLSIADISAFLKLIGKLSLSKKIDLGIIEKLSDFIR